MRNDNKKNLMVGIGICIETANLINCVSIIKLPMSTFIRGPVCGTDNCPSRLWRIIAGRRTCQYGHVMEGDVEYNDDDDAGLNAGVITRRLNLTTNAVGSFQSSLNASQLNHLHKTVTSKKVYGYEARLLFLKSFQYVLKKQCNYLITNMNFPAQFQDIVKYIWLKYLKYISDEDTLSQDGFTLDAEDDDNSDSNNPDNTISSDDERKRIKRLRRERKNQKLNIHMSTSISILYLACTHMRIPVYTCDFIRWICSAKLPYFKSDDIIPKQWRERLPNYYLGILEGGKPPIRGQLYTKISSTCARTNFTKEHNYSFNLKAFVVRLLVTTIMPPEFYFYTLHLIHIVDREEEFCLFEEEKNEYKYFDQFPEIRAICYFILTIRWILRCDAIDSNFQTYPTPWILAHLEPPLDGDSSQIGIEKQVARLFYDDEQTDAFNWNDKQTLDYLEWIESQFMPNQGGHVNERNEATMTIDQKIARRKLYKIIPLENSSISQLPKRQKLMFADELQEKYLSLRNYMETYVLDNNKKIVEDENGALILKLEEKLIRELAMEFVISKEQLSRTIRKIESTCFSAK